MYTIEYSKQAVRALMRMPSNTAITIRNKLLELAQDPLAARNVDIELESSSDAGNLIDFDLPDPLSKDAAH